MTYIIGWNMPGFLPEMEPVNFETLDEARLSLADELEAFGRAVDDPPDFNELDNLDEFFNAATFLREHSLTGDFSQTIGDYVYWIMESRS